MASQEPGCGPPPWEGRCVARPPSVLGSSSLQPGDGRGLSGRAPAARPFQAQLLPAGSALGHGLAYPPTPMSPFLSLLSGSWLRFWASSPSQLFGTELLLLQYQGTGLRVLEQGYMLVLVSFPSFPSKIFHNRHLSIKMPTKGPFIIMLQVNYFSAVFGLTGQEPLRSCSLSLFQRQVS